MAILSFPLGYGKKGFVELDTFTRMLNDQIYDTEEIRMDKPSDWLNGYEYMGLAESGSATTSAVWCCIRNTWVNNRKIRIQYRANIVWDDRTIGW